MHGWRKALYHTLIVGGSALTIYFGVFWFSPARLPRDANGGTSALGITMFVMLSFVVWQRQLVEMLVWWVCRKVRPVIATPPVPQGFRVAFITTFVPSSEPLDMLERTLRAMLAADYPHDTWVLDEGADADAQLLAESLGVRYFTRKGIAHYNTDGGTFAAKTKGGNHSAWLNDHGDGYDIVAEIDTDFIASPDYLLETLGYFADPTVAFVGTPQVYGNVNDSLIARGAAQQTYLFYGAIMRGFGDRGMGLLIGANHVIRVSALREIGWYCGHLTEDLATGMTLHSRRWRSVYVPKVLAVGEGPTTWAGYFSQQYRWAFGCLDILACRTARLAVRMRLKQALMYPLLQSFYLNGLAMIVAVGLLATYFVTGRAPAHIEFRSLALTYLPLLVWRQVITRFLQTLNVRPRQESGWLTAGRVLTVAAMPVYFLALIGVIRRRRMSFTVTPKGGQARESSTRQLFRPHTTLMAVSGAGALAGAATRNHAAVMEGWAVLTFLTYLYVPFSVQLWERARTVKYRLAQHLYGPRARPATMLPWELAGQYDADAAALPSALAPAVAPDTQALLTGAPLRMETGEVEMAVRSAKRGRARGAD